MKFKVTGQNKDTGARQTMEFEAGSKGSAERKATQAGMDVQHCEQLTDSPAEDAAPTKPRVSHRGEHEPSSNKGKLVAAVVGLLVAAAVVMYWDSIKGMVGM
jgi:hypothetical protein